MSIAVPTIDEKTFLDLYHLMSDHRWLHVSQKALIELWNFCDDENQRELIKELLNRFVMVESLELEENCKKIYEHISQFEYPIGRTFLVAVSDGRSVDGSVTGLDLLKNKFPSTLGWKESYFSPNILDFVHNVKSNSHVIIFDDFIGSGKKVILKLQYFYDTIKTRKIKINSVRVISFAAMEEGVKNIKDIFDVDIYSPIILKKGISDYNTPVDASRKIILMTSLEQKLKPKFKKLRLNEHFMGYKQVEALFSIYGKNCPNNVFPIFWWPEDRLSFKRNTLLTRIR